MLKKVQMAEHFKLFRTITVRPGLGVQSDFPTYLCFLYSSNKIRKTQNEHLDIICQNLNSQ
jgi:hypothetical protein